MKIKEKWRIWERSDDMNSREILGLNQPNFPRPSYTELASEIFEDISSPKLGNIFNNRYLYNKLISSDDDTT